MLLKSSRIKPLVALLILLPCLLSYSRAYSQAYSRACLTSPSENTHDINNLNNEKYIFYSTDNKIIATLSKNVMYQLSRVACRNSYDSSTISLSSNFSKNYWNNIPELSPESWLLLLQYLQAHERKSQSLKNSHEIDKALHDIGCAPKLTLLDLLDFSRRYELKEIQVYLMPCIVRIWKEYQYRNNIKSLEYLVDNFFYDKAAFRKSLSHNPDYYPYFHDLIEDSITLKKLVTTIAISSDNKFTVLGSNDGTVQLYDRATQETTTIATHNDYITSVAISNNNKFIVSGSRDGTIKLYNKKRKRTATLITQNSWVCCLAISSNNEFIVWGSNNGALRLYSSKNNTIEDIITCDKFESSITSVAISNNNKFIVFGDLSGKTKVYDTVNRSIKKFDAHNGSIEKIMMLNDNEFISLKNHSQSINLYNITTEKSETIINYSAHPTSIALSNDKNFIVLGFYDGTVKLYDLNKNGTLRYNNTYGETLSNHSGSILSIAISSDNYFAAIGLSDGTLKIAGDTDKLNDCDFFKLIEKIEREKQRHYSSVYGSSVNLFF